MIVTETESRAGQRGARAQKVSGLGSDHGAFLKGVPCPCVRSWVGGSWRDGKLRKKLRKFFGTKIC